jgi:hypothetical protein
MFVGNSKMVSRYAASSRFKPEPLAYLVSDIPIWSKLMKLVKYFLSAHVMQWMIWTNIVCISFQLVKTLPSVKYLFTPQSQQITFRMLTELLKPSFSQEGSNSRKFENEIYSQFIKYMREVAGKSLSIYDLFLYARRDVLCCCLGVRLFVVSNCSSAL